MADSIFGLEHDDEYWRLRGFEAAYDPTTLRLLDELGVAPGWRCLEVGAGTGSIAMALHARAGSVTALDQDCRYIRHLASPSFVVVESAVELADLPNDRDLIHCRFLLDLVREPRDVLEKLSSCVRASGWLLVEEFDDLTLEVTLRDGRVKELHDAIVAAKQGLWAERGLNNHLGRHLPDWLTQLGLVDVESECGCRVRLGGTNGVFAWKQSLIGMRDGVLKNGVSQADLDEYLSLLDDGGISYFSPLVVKAWGRVQAA